jgi:hypothetical protein
MSRVQIWKQESQNKMTRLVFLPKGIKDGPKDDDIEIVGVVPVMADDNGDFLLDPNYNIEAFDSVHAFTIVRQIMTMYQRSLWRIGRDRPLKWQWGPSQIGVNPRAGNSPGASYSRNERSLNFFSSKSEGKLNHSIRSFEVAAHEVGHAILDSIRPGYWSSWQAETGALHESMADLTVIFATLAQLDLCRSIVFLTRGDLKDKSYFWIANGGAVAAADRAQGKGFAAADHDLTMYEVAAEVHDISLVFTGAVYDILADVFEYQRDPDLKDDTETLFKVGQHVMDLLLKAILGGPPQNATFKDVADRMIPYEKNTSIKQIIRKHFEARCILGKDRIVPPLRPVDDIRWGGCQCCLSSKEHLFAVEDGIKSGLSCLPTAKRILYPKSR